ncbi:MAG: hypothetical protein KDB27_12120 [Planctomycetales bacterium]|nr:hypothetical protein [Planctomycetales bacterium]
MKTRFPFRYGIATMTEAPHLFVQTTVEANGQIVHGISSDGLPPKWFTKNSDTAFQDDDLPSMLRVIRNAADIGVQLGRRRSFFDWWRGLYQAQHDWADENGIEQLLAGFGVSLIERAVLDAVCRSLNSPLHKVLRENALEVDFRSLRPQLRSITPADVLPNRPRSKVAIRHTVGLSDVLSNTEHANRDASDDGLPYTLEENIQTYGIRYFKIKLCGDAAADRDRLREIFQVIERTAGTDARFTLDGNESFPTIEVFRRAWTDFLADDSIRGFAERSLLFVEQPVDRAATLSDDCGRDLAEWTDAPPIIIDESDADMSSFPRALELGYSGTSHKNCKGILKGLFTLATVFANETESGTRPILSAEDLGNVGPVALLQDLASVATFGISHVERNGHHYFAGLSMFSDELQQLMLEHHGDLYSRRGGFVALNPQNGDLHLDSVNAAPFGLQPLIDVSQFASWDF